MKKAYHPVEPDDTLLYSVHSVYIVNWFEADILWILVIQSGKEVRRSTPLGLLQVCVWLIRKAEVIGIIWNCLLGPFNRWNDIILDQTRVIDTNR